MSSEKWWPVIAGRGRALRKLKLVSSVSKNLASDLTSCDRWGGGPEGQEVDCGVLRLIDGKVGGGGEKGSVGVGEGDREREDDEVIYDERGRGGRGGRDGIPSTKRERIKLLRD